MKRKVKLKGKLSVNANRNILLIGLLITVVILSSVEVSAITAVIDTQAEWDAKYTAQFGSTVQAGYPGQDTSDYTTSMEVKSRLFGHGSYWLRSYTSMARTFGDTKHMDMSVELIDFMLANTDEARHARGEIDIIAEPYTHAPQYILENPGAPAPGWRRWYQYGSNPGWRVMVLDDGAITNSIMTFVDLAYSDSRFTAYIPKAAGYLQKVEDIANSHNESFVYSASSSTPDFYRYSFMSGGSPALSGNPVMLNQGFVMGTTLLFLDKVKRQLGQTPDPEYRRKAEAMVQYWRDYVRLTGNNEYEWDYDPVNPSNSGVEDITHGQLDMQFLNLAYQLGVGGLTSTDMDRFANTARRMYKGGGDFSQDIDGTGIISRDYINAIGNDWIDLLEFDPTLIDPIIEAYNKYYVNPFWSRPYFGWAEIMRWTLAPPAVAVCGNNILEVGEQCDDGNTITGDGCSSTCQIEAGPNPDSLANGSTMIANSQNFNVNNPVQGLWDGCLNGSTSCSPGNSGQISFWVEYDLGQLYNLTQARLFGDAEGTWLSKSWTLQYKQNSNDTWQTAFSNINALFNDWSTQSLVVQARFVNVTVFGDPIKNAVQAREFELFGTPSSIPTTCNILNKQQCNENVGCEALYLVEKKNFIIVTPEIFTSCRSK